MKIGDLELVGIPEDSPEESSVDADYAYFYEGKMTAPMASLLPTLTVSGTEETKPGGWRVLCATFAPGALPLGRSEFLPALTWTEK